MTISLIYDYVTTPSPDYVILFIISNRSLIDKLYHQLKSIFLYVPILILFFVVRTRFELVFVSGLHHCVYLHFVSRYNTWPFCPTLRLLVSRYIGFLFLKNLLVLPVKNIQHYWEGLCKSLCPKMSHSRRRHSAESFLSLDSKTLSISYSLRSGQDSNL